MRKYSIILFLIVIAILNAIFWFWGPNIISFTQTRTLPFYKSRWQAVYMANGDIYIGQIKSISSHTIKLSNAYNLQIITNQVLPGQSPSLKLQTGAIKNIALVKWGFYQPLLSKGELYINRSAMFFWENLSSDSEIVKQLSSGR